MKDFDKIFSEKLYDHKSPPSSAVWDQLDAALEAEEQRKKKFIFWRVAAAVLLLIVAGGAFWFSREDSKEMMAVSPAQTEEKTSLQPEKQLSEDSSAKDVPSIPEQKADNSLALNQEKVAKPSERKPLSAEKEAVPQENTEMPQTAENTEEMQFMANENTADPELISKVNPLELQPLDAASVEMLALDIQQPIINAPVELIYKPGEVSPKHESNADRENALELLADLKNSGINLAEIRSAKSELLAKVFNKLENEVIR